MGKIIDYLKKKSWDVFRGRDPTIQNTLYSGGYTSSIRPDSFRLSHVGNARSIVSSIYNQIAVDCCSIDIQHVRLDDKTGKFKETINDSLNRALTTEANVDQSGRQMIRDAVLTMFDEGVAAIVPSKTDVDPSKTDAYKVEELRVGTIKEWFPKHIRVSLYNDKNGQKEEIVLEKRIVAIIENPFSLIMNEPNSLTKRLIRVLNQLDRTNEENSSGKADIFIQLPYTIRSESKQKLAEERRQNIIDQLSSETGSKYGIAYIDNTEKVIQLNRSLENNLWEQAKELTIELFNNLGMSESIFNGTADEATLLNYHNRTIEPILTAITEGMERKWISRTAQTQNQGIRFFKDPFKLVPVSQVAEIADKFTRNEIMTSNEIRSVLGMKPSNDPKADQLINSNLNHPDEDIKNRIMKEEENGKTSRLRL